MGSTHINNLHNLERQNRATFYLTWPVSDYGSGNKYLTEKVGKIRAKLCASAPMGPMRFRKAACDYTQFFYPER